VNQVHVDTRLEVITLLTSHNICLTSDTSKERSLQRLHTTFNMARSTQRVAVIGAGISGVATAAHLKKEGIEVTVFERSSAAGGVWYVLYLKINYTNP
jgi:NADPH-dependent glutamate synthase beta subunit-like oxidoreductase